jgi:predicted RNA-binding Zn-ribbon protein involved in translation (DUF1610 family)
MTGVAAQLCGDRATVESLGYNLDKDGTISQQETEENGKKVWKPFSRLGARRVILNDLSPAATFIAYNYNSPVDLTTFEREAKRILKELEDECGWMYETFHIEGKTKGRINYTVWSEVFACPECGDEIIYYDTAFQQGTFEVVDTFTCPHCHSILNKKSLQRLWNAYLDEPLRKSHQLVRYLPVRINYQVGNNRYEKKPDAYDLSVLKNIDEDSITDWFPAHEMLDGERKGKDGNHLKGITHLHLLLSEGVSCLCPTVAKDGNLLLGLHSVLPARQQSRLYQDEPLFSQSLFASKPLLFWNYVCWFTDLRSLACVFHDQQTETSL